MKVCVVLGTRPEGIKLAPVITRLREHETLRPIIISTGQHREMLTQTLDYFGLRPDVDLELFRPGQRLEQMTAHALEDLGRVLSEIQPGLTIVQGDTTATFAGALASFYSGVPVAHVEAGLRTPDPRLPFPEEMNRRLVSRLTDLHLPATTGAQDNLLAEGVAVDDIVVTGNTVIDALLTATTLPNRLDPDLDAFTSTGAALMLVTVHRRESWGEGIDRVAMAVRTLLEREPDLRVVIPMHRNPVVRASLVGPLGGHERVRLIEPLDYLDFVQMLMRSTVVLTDSGGVQEEGPSLGKPILVVRENTERPEGIAAGTAKLVGTDPGRIVGEVLQLLRSSTAYAAMAQAVNPYGDGHASGRIVDALQRRYLDRTDLSSGLEELLNAESAASLSA